jgi:hypothetical protein
MRTRLMDMATGPPRHQITVEIDMVAGFISLGRIGAPLCPRFGPDTFPWSILFAPVLIRNGLEPGRIFLSIHNREHLLEVLRPSRSGSHVLGKQKLKSRLQFLSCHLILLCQASGKVSVPHDNVPKVIVRGVPLQLTEVVPKLLAPRPRHLLDAFRDCHAYSLMKRSLYRLA